MDLNSWFHWVFPSLGYFLLALIGLIVLLGLIGGLTDTRKFGDADNSSSNREDSYPDKPWWKTDEENYQEWNERQVREQNRT